MNILKKDIKRILPDSYVRGKQLSVKMSREGLWIRCGRERWSSAYLIPWDAVYSVGAKLKAKENAQAQKERRKARLLVKRNLL